MSGMWIEDDLPSFEYEHAFQYRGDAYSSDGGDLYLPDITNPIGFIRRKPRVRVKAWTMPIPKET